MESELVARKRSIDQAETKQCFKCGQEKALSEFYKHPQMADGHLNKCKTCTKVDVSTNYRHNIEHYKEYECKRNQSRWAYKTEQCRLWRKKNPEKYKAHTAVNNALRSGELKKQECLVCGDPNTHAHHDDYSKPLEVLWLCPQHHRDYHKQVA